MHTHARANSMDKSLYFFLTHMLHSTQISDMGAISVDPVGLRRVLYYVKCDVIEILLLFLTC